MRRSTMTPATPTSNVREWPVERREHRTGRGARILRGSERAARWIGEHERCWPAELSILTAVGLYIALPGRLLLGPRYLIPGLELLLLIAIRGTGAERREIAAASADGRSVARRLGCMALARHPGERRAHRHACIALIALVTATNAATLTMLSAAILDHARGTNGRALLLAALAIWTTNVLVFSLWYWETDRGGPGARACPEVAGHEDFRFPQEDQDSGFRPAFVDYLYLAFTNATAFSPTDALPVTHRAKLAMMLQSLISLLTVLLVAARAVNILN